MKLHGLRRIALLALSAFSALAFAEGNEIPYPTDGRPHSHHWEGSAPRNGETFYMSVPTQGMCATDVKEIKLCDVRFSLNVGQQKTFYFDRRFLVRSIVVHAISNGYGPAGFDTVVNGVSTHMVAPPDGNRDRYEIPVNQEASEFSLVNTGTDNSQAWLNVNRVLVNVSPVDTTGKEICIRQADFVCKQCSTPEGGRDREWSRESKSWNIPVFYRTPIANMAHVISRTLDELDDFFDYEEKSCFVKPIKAASLAAIGRAEGLSEAASVAQPYFQRLLEELDCEDPFFTDFSARRHAENKIERIIRTREALRKELMLRDNICPMRTLIKRIESGCIDATYLHKIEERQDIFSNWYKDRSEDAARNEAQQDRLKELLQQLEEDEEKNGQKPLKARVKKRN